MTEPAPKFFETADFLALQTEWRKRLSKAGFKDIETERGSLRIDRCDREDRRRLADPTDMAQYRTMTQRWLFARVWPSRHRRRLWELHSEGVGIRTITVRLRPMHGNHKSITENLLYEERAHMMQWVNHDVMMSERELQAANPAPNSVWESAMMAEGFDPAGYLVESDGTVNRWRR